MKSNDVCMIGIYGIGGIGKTTIVRYIYIYIYNKFSWGFECSSFLEDAKKVFKNKVLLCYKSYFLMISKREEIQR